MKLKSVVTNLFFVIVLIYLNYQIYLGFSTGKFNPVGKGMGDMLWEESPVMFVISMGLTIFLSALVTLIITHSMCSKIDSQVRAYGGNYNVSTFKAIIKGLRG